MSRGKKKRLNADLFTPTGQSVEERRLAASHPEAVVAAIGPMLTEERRAVIENAVRHRCKTLHVAVEGVHDPHNTAAIIRSADAYGILNIHIIENPQAKFRSSAAVTQGAHKWVEVHVHPDTPAFVSAMQEQGVLILVADMDGAVDVGEVSTAAPVVLVFGNEAEGISDRMRSLADGAFKIPMYGFVERFNVSVAAAISISTLRAGGGGDLTPSEQDTLRARYYLRSVRAGVDIVRRLL